MQDSAAFGRHENQSVLSVQSVVKKPTATDPFF
jgi:hypothetical protein